MTDTAQTSDSAAAPQPASSASSASPAPASPPAAQVPAAQAPPAQSRPQPPDKNPLLAGFLSMVLCGLGNIYNGLYGRAVVFFALFISIFFTTVRSGDGPHLALLIPSMAFVWFFNVFDAYRQATLINYGWAGEAVELRKHQTSGGVAAGVALLVIGSYGLLEQFFDIDLTILLDHWYFIALALGGWLVWQGLKNRDADDLSVGPIDEAA